MFRIPDTDLSRFNTLPLPVQREALEYLDVFRKMHENGGVKFAEQMERSLKGHGDRPKRGFSADNLRTKWYGYFSDGKGSALRSDDAWTSLINHSKMPKDAGLPQAFKDWWLNHLKDFKLAQPVATAQRAFLMLWKQGASVAGLGTWQQWFSKCHPGRPVPINFPWGVNFEPPSISYRNLARIKAGKTENALTMKGVAAARLSMPGVMQDLSLLKVLEQLCVDDFRTDFKAWDWHANQVVEIWGLAILDVATRKILCFRLMPRVIRKDGTKTGINKRDMMHLIADYLTIYGYPADYDQTWIVENASAAITTAMEEALKMISGGRIKVRRTAMFSGKAILGGFTDESSGNPHGKIIETKWKTTWMEVCNTAGYIGASYQLKPAEAENRFRHITNLITAGQSLGMERAELEQFTTGLIPSMEDANALLRAVWERDANREKHEMRGFDTVKTWRYKDTSEWFNADEKPLPPFPLELMASHVESLVRPETSNERLQKLLKRDGLNRRILTPDELWFILQDKSVIKYEGAMSFKVQRMVEGRKKSVFFNPGNFADQLTPGSRYVLAYDLDNLHFVNVLSVDEQRLIGHAPAFTHANPNDQAALEESFRESERNFQKTIKRVKARQPITDLTDKQDAIEELDGRFNQLLPAPTAPALPGGRLSLKGARRETAATPQIDYQAAAMERLLNG